MTLSKNFALHSQCNLQCLLNSTPGPPTVLSRSYLLSTSTSPPSSFTTGGSVTTLTVILKCLPEALFVSSLRLVIKLLTLPFLLFLLVETRTSLLRVFIKILPLSSYKPSSPLSILFPSFWLPSLRVSLSSLTLLWPYLESYLSFLQWLCRSPPSSSRCKNLLWLKRQTLHS